MNRMAPGALALCASMILACGAGVGSGQSQQREPQLLYSCGPNGVQPPAKLIIPTSGGVSGRWMVVLSEDATPLHTIAVQLATKFGGSVLDEWESINGFLISLDDSKAPALSQEPTVCWVEQDQVVSLD